MKSPAEMLGQMKTRLAEIKDIHDSGVAYMAMVKAGESARKGRTPKTSASLDEAKAFLAEYQPIVDEGAELAAMIEACEKWMPPSLLPLSMESGDVQPGEKKIFSLELPIPFALLEFSIGPANVDKFDIMGFRCGLLELVGIARAPTSANEFMTRHALLEPLNAGPGYGPVMTVRNISKKMASLRATLYGFDLTTRQGSAWMERKRS